VLKFEGAVESKGLEEVLNKEDVPVGALKPVEPK
jgi:hypothetical protein